MHGTVQTEFIEDVCAVLTTIVVPPGEQGTKAVTASAGEVTGSVPGTPGRPGTPGTPGTTGTPQTGRRRSFLNDAVVRQPSFRSRTLDDVSRAQVSSSPSQPAPVGIKDHIVVVCTSADDLQYVCVLGVRCAALAVRLTVGCRAAGTWWRRFDRRTSAACLRS